MSTYSVTIRRHDGSDSHVVATGESERTADRIASGASINLDHENWYVDVEEESDES